MKKIIGSAIAFAALAFGTSVLAAAFTPGNLVIYRVGGVASGADGAALTNTGNIVWLDEYTTAGSHVQSIMMPTNFFGANSPLLADALATTEGEITRSTDGRFIALTGYGVTIGQITNFALPSEFASTVPRVVGLVDGNAHIDTTTVQTNTLSDAEGFRSAATTDGTNLWFSGDTSGLRYAPRGVATATQLSSFITNLRQINIFGNHLYFSDASGSAIRIGFITNSMPVTASGSTMSNLVGLATSVGSPYGFLLLKLTGGADPFDTLYYADDSAQGTDGIGVIFKYSLVGGIWSSNGLINAPAVRGLTGFAEVSGGTTNVHLFATTGGSTGNNIGGGSLYAYVDSTSYNHDPGNPDVNDIVDISSAGDANGSVFRGIAFAPVGGETPLTGPALLSVGPITDFFDGNGLTGGPFPFTKNYSVANLGGSPMTWGVSSPSNWVSFSTSGNTLASGGSITVTVSFNGNANSLTAGTNLTTITFTNSTVGNLGSDLTSRPATLIIADQTVTPTGSFSSSGQPGGPFTPLTKIYTLSNGVAPGSISWAVSHTVANTWLGLSATSGTLAPGAGTNITVSIVTNNANLLAAGNYADVVSFSNLTANALVDSRQVSLAVGSLFFCDDFSTFAPGNLVPQQGWTQPGSSASAPPQVSNGMVYVGAILGGSDQEPFKNFPQTTDNFVFVGMVITVTSAPPVTVASPSRIATFFDLNNTGSFAVNNLSVRDTGTNQFVFCARISGQAGTPQAFGTVPLNYGTPYRVIMQGDPVKNSNTWVYVNPVNSTLDTNTAYVVGIPTGTYSPDQILGSFEIGNSFSTATTIQPGVAFAKICISTNYAEVFNDISGSPPPSDPFTAWQAQYFTGSPLSSAPGADPLGKGMSNTNQFLAGFNPTNAAAYVHITNITKTNGSTDIRVDYLGASGNSSTTPPMASRTNVLEFTTGTGGSYNSNNFASTGQTNILSGGVGLGTLANMVDPGGATNVPARYYRVRVLVP